MVKLISSEPVHLAQPRFSIIVVRFTRRKTRKSHLASSIDVTDISGNTWRSTDIVKTERGDERI
jgi:hypothetical protein